MTVPSDVIRNEYTGNGVATDFDFDFKIFDEAEILVSVADDDGEDVSDDYVLNTDYEVTINDDGTGGTVSFNSALTDDYTLVLTPNLDIVQETSISNQGGFFPSVVENALDRLTIICKMLQEQLDRCPKIDITSGASSDEYLQDAEAAAAAAAASQTAAASSASSASTSASTATTQAAAAAASAAAAAATLASALWNEITRISTNTTLTSAHNGHLIVVDTSGGAVTVTMPTLATVGEPFNCGVRKDTSDTNAVTIARASTDVFDDGDTSLSITGQDAGYVLIGDTDTSPDEWVSTAFGPVSSNFLNPDYFSGNGATTGFTLTTAPGTENAIDVRISGVAQARSTYSVSGTTLTFSSAPASGTNNIEVIYLGGAALAAGTPSDSSVTTAKLASGVANGLTTVTLDVDADYAVIADASDGGAVKKGLIPASSDTVKGAIELAVQAEMEAASDTARAVVPGRMHFHPAMPKAVVKITNMGVASPTVTALYTALGTVSCSRSATGTYSVSWVTAITTPIFQLTVHDTAGSRIADVTGETSSTAVAISVKSDSGADDDPNSLYLTIYGDI